VLINTSLKDDDDDIQRRMKSLYCAANKLRSSFDQCSPAAKNTQFRAYGMPMYAYQLWSTQACMKRLGAAYNNVYQIMHYIPRNLSVCPNQVSHRVTTFDALWINNLYRFLQLCTSSSNFFSVLFKCLMLFTNIRFSSIVSRCCLTVTS